MVAGWSVIACLLGCGETAKQPSPTKPKPVASPAPAGAQAVSWTWKLPKGHIEPPAVPTDNPMSQAKVDLGHRLFMDKRLSIDGTRSCYSCHQNELGNADGRPTALGPLGKVLPRNTPTIWNVGLHPALYWDGRAPSLEAQAIGALKGGNMGLGDTMNDKAAELGALPDYAKAFQAVFELKADETVTPDHIVQALSAYERTLLCGDSPFDTGDLKDAALRGRDLFIGKASCTTCHSGPALSDGLFHIVGVAADPKDPNTDHGRGKITGQEADDFAFRTPTLRNVSLSGPYFHDGSEASLAKVVRIMASGGQPKPGLTLDSNMVDRHLTDAEIDDLVAFLEILTCKNDLDVLGEQSPEDLKDAPPQ